MSREWSRRAMFREIPEGVGIEVHATGPWEVDEIYPATLVVKGTLTNSSASGVRDNGSSYDVIIVRDHHVPDVETWIPLAYITEFKVVLP